ncbi:alpha/beta hydrolase family protein [Vibrio ouci]|uniref:Alpha/beta fold hydrolase n=1 Tax=Vibrio ouci TaxID=2499078 RepID=A0A4Y8WCC4_9VIBR|nr:alpha/beta fold hydrolase [Vibrio ouci]TFH90273.1 alpha/beta fold hydrolase [Vibrio ouci]
MKWTLLLFAALLSLSTLSFAAETGFRQVILKDNPARPLNTTIWYPTQAVSDRIRVGDTALFIGTSVIHNADLSPGKFPVVVLSHGYLGSWRSLNWLASALARRGYIVAAADHPGTTALDLSPQHAAQWWERPRDVSRLLTYLQTEPRWKHALDTSNISAIGHSLGGWTVMQLAGAQIDRPKLKAGCLTFPSPLICELSEKLGLSRIQGTEPNHNDLSDPRIKRVISLDLGVARSLSVKSLKETKVPSLILAAGIDIVEIPQAHESGYIAEHLPLNLRRYKVYEAASHFSFMQRCKPSAKAMMATENPGDSIVCSDGAATPRLQLHQAMLADIVAFLES